MQKPEPLVSVVMPAYRMGVFIAGALDSVASQAHANWEVVVVDDLGPEDGTHAIVDAFAARMGGDRVRLVRHTENKGVSAARNTGIAHAKAEYVAFLDPDDQWMTDHLERLVALFRERPDLDVATGPVEIFSDDPGETVTWVSPQGDWHRRYFPHTLSINNFIQPSASVVRRSTLEAAGGFDTDPAIQHIEDYDLWIRLVERGCRFAFLPTPSSRYRKHEGGATADLGRMRKLEDELLRKHTGFFRDSAVKLQQLMLTDIARHDRELIDLRIRYNGPIMRSVLALDHLLRRLYGGLKGR